jgi:putative flippase GtrA
MSRLHQPLQDMQACGLLESAEKKRANITLGFGAGRPALAEHSLPTLFKRMESHAPVIRRIVSFLCIGGLGAVLNLLCFSVLYHTLLGLSINLGAYFIAFVVAAELSLCHNFLLNDWMTFRNLRSRHWTMRCLRFHITSTGGILLTLGISFSLFHFLAVSALVAQGTALVAATLFNLIFHHFFTYA